LLIHEADAKVAVKAFEACKKGKGVAACSAERAVAVAAVSTVVKAECSAYTEDFFKCFTHKYQLSSCSDATVSQLLKCQDQLTGNLLK